MTAASTFSTQMTQLTGNAGGGIQSLPPVTTVGGRERVFVANIGLASQASGSIIGVARLPLGAIITGITLLTDTSLGSATIALGDTNSAALFAAAATLTNVNTPTRVGLAATHGAPITAGYDCTTGASTAAPKGGQYEDVTLTTASASLPSTGNLAIIFEYSID
jgi:hypothetical protein